MGCRSCCVLCSCFVFRPASRQHGDGILCLASWRTIGRREERVGEREGYPEDVLRRLQQVELEMLRRIDRACRAIGVSYWLDSGTCLGAVRHGGFIPWDDDIDIGMPLDDYHRFLEEAPAVLGEGLSLHTCDNTPNLPVLWAKIYLDGTRFSSARDIEAGLEQGITKRIND